MLKQVFDSEQLSKVISSSDVWRWNILSNFENVEAAVNHTVQNWKLNNISISPLKKSTLKNKNVFTPCDMSDAFAIKLLDRFSRRIYKVRQSDRNRIIRQIITLLKDSGNYHILRLDIKDCYESIVFKRLIDKFEEDLILSPDCLTLLNNIHNDLSENHQMYGLPRGLSISPTLAELYLETLDKKIAEHSGIIYSARYVDDIIVMVPSGKENNIEIDIKSMLNEMGLDINNNVDKYYSGSSNSAEFEYLGYSIKVSPRNNKPNFVGLKISQSKLKKIKLRILKSFLDHKRERNFPLLKRRLEYLCMLKVVRKGKNGNLLAGLAHNYQYVTDEFDCLKSIDGFLCNLLSLPRFDLNHQEQNSIKKISMYGNAKKRNIGKFSRKKTNKIMQVWKNV